MSSTCPGCGKPIGDGDAYLDGDQLFHGQECISRYRAQLSGLSIECPNCRGSGKEDDQPIYDRTLDDEATEREQEYVFRTVLVGHTKKPCGHCGGAGYLKPEPTVQPPWWL